MKRTLTLTMTALALTTSVAAQEVMVAYPVAQAPLIKERIEARAAVESRITTGAPYSAEAVTESLQVLSDGNRIARKTATRVYRDSEGRTRREQLTSTGTVQSVTISDPVAGSMYVLNPAERTAQRNGVFMAGAGGGFGVATVAPESSGTVTAARTADGGVRVSASGSNEAGRRRETEAQVAGEGSAGVAAGSVTSAAGGASAVAVPVAGGVAYSPEAMAMTMPRMVAPRYAGGAVNKEDLGQQVIEGVLATGTRMTTTIPAGSIGNEQPILVVSEQWFSPDLKVLVMTKHSDPRSGENTYRLTNITQTEPARSLFEVPADYTLKDSVIRRQSPMLPQ
jgi:hypothetical protein